MFYNLIDKILKYFSKTSVTSFIVLTSLFAVIVICIYYLGQSSELTFYDLMIKVTTQSTGASKAKSDDRIIMVFIDDQSVEKMGRWPWPRTRYIELFDYLQNKAKAKVITFDSIIKGGDSCTPANDDYFFSHLKDFPTLRTGIDFIEKPISLGKDLNYNPELTKFALTNVEDRRTEKNKIGQYTLNSPVNVRLIKNVAGLGSVLTDPLTAGHEDKKVRTISHISTYEGKYYPSLSLTSVMAFYNELNPKIIIYDNKIEILFKAKKVVIPVELIKEKYRWEVAQKNFISSFISNIEFLLDTSDEKYYYKTWIKWYKPLPGRIFTHKAVSAYQIFEAIEKIKKGQKPDLDPALFKDKIVVLGATATAITATGTEDIKATPLMVTQPGVDIQATCIDNLLNSDFMEKASGNIKWYILLAILVILALILLFTQDKSMDKSQDKAQELSFIFLFILFIVVIYILVVMYVLYPRNIVIDTVTPLSLLCIIPLLIFTYKYLIEKFKRGQIQTVFKKLLSEELMDETIKDPDKVKIGGERSEITVLFSDIRGFTTLSEELPPEKISELLYEYFQAMEPIVKQNNGIIDKYIGDAIMAIFGAPVKYSDHALHAAQAAFEMQKALEELNEKWKKQKKFETEKGKYGFEIGIGINTGTSFLGYVGSQNRMNYTAIGDAVNVASRLEQLNKSYNTRIIISESTYEKVRNYVEVRALKKENIRGRKEPVMVYELKGIRDLKNIIIDYK